jgi:hypothetical protein
MLECWRIHVEKTASKVNRPFRNFLLQSMARGAEEESGLGRTAFFGEHREVFPHSGSWVLNPESRKHRPDFDDPVFRQFASIQQISPAHWDDMHHILDRELIAEHIHYRLCAGA